MILEVIATSAEDVLRANAGGADRIELCADLREGGLTPDGALIETAVRTSRIPVHVLIRPHSRSFVYDETDLRAIRQSIAFAKRAGAAGVVIGALTPERRVDMRALRSMLGEADGLKVTFHRAFDESRDLDEALADLLSFPEINRLLTSGGANSVLDAIDTIAKLRRDTRDTRLAVLAGAGLTVDAIADFVRRTQVSEIHLGRGVREGMSADRPVDAETVRQAKSNL